MSRLPWRLLALCWVMVCWPASVNGDYTPPCHLHPPATAKPAKPPQPLDFYDRYEACSQQNQWRFSGLGRCHCSFGNLPGAGQFPMEKRVPIGAGVRRDSELP